jgi:chromosome segregation ATPase
VSNNPDLKKAITTLRHFGLAGKAWSDLTEGLSSAEKLLDNLENIEAEASRASQRLAVVKEEAEKLQSTGKQKIADLEQEFLGKRRALSEEFDGFCKDIKTEKEKLSTNLNLAKTQTENLEKKWKATKTRLEGEQKELENKLSDLRAKVSELLGTLQNVTK